MRKAFTLVEVLVVLALAGLLFGMLSFAFYRASNGSLSLLQLSENVKREAVLYWELERKIIGAKEIHIENDRIYMLTTGGSLYEGVVKCAYFVKDGVLFYYEFPYPYLSLDDIEETKAYKVMEVKNFKVRAKIRDSEVKTLIGLPDYVLITIDDRRFTYKVVK